MAYKVIMYISLIILFTSSTLGERCLPFLPRGGKGVYIALNIVFPFSTLGVRRLPFLRDAGFYPANVRSFGSKD